MNRFTPESLAEHYSHFRVTERILLTGHSHQAWPDVGFVAQQQAWLDAAEHVDDKWGHAFKQSLAVRHGFAKLLGENNVDNLVLAASTHDLLIKYLSALPLKDKPQIVTTDGEFHSLRRQLERLEEEGVDVIRIATTDLDSLCERLASSITDKTASVMLSAVMFQDASIVPSLNELATACANKNVPLLIDAYHAMNVIPFDITEQNLSSAFIVGGGYKYCQLGEGNCFLRVPDNCEMRPVATGWYAEFEVLQVLEQKSQGIPYPIGAARFIGSTYDPTSQYRGAAVFDFFTSMNMNPQALRESSQHQIGLMCQEFDRQSFDPNEIARLNRPLNNTAGFLALRTPRASELQAKLKASRIHCNFRGDYLRLGPAPYITDTQIIEAMATLTALI